MGHFESLLNLSREERARRYAEKMLLGDNTRRESTDCGRGEDRKVGGVNPACTTEPEKITLPPAQENNSSPCNPNANGHTDSAQKPHFDKVAYQREYMRLRRAEAKLKKT